MRTLIQRVSKAQVSVDGQVVGQIGPGITVFLGISEEDTEKDIDFLVEKLQNLRIFPHEKGHFEQSLLDVKGEVLVISQFTLYSDTQKGRRPSFIKAAEPEKAKDLYQKFVERFKTTGLKVEEGEFQAMMEVELVNDGPATFMVESK